MIPLLLAAAFALSGKVQDVSGAPIAGARIVCDAEHLSVSGVDGRFSIQPGQTWPDALMVSAGGFGTQIVPVPPVHATGTLSAIVLRPGTTLRIHVERGRENRPLDVSVGIASVDGKPRWIALRHIEGTAGTVVVSGLSSGVYVVLVRGPEPMEAIAVKAIVGDGETRDVSVVISDARRLRLRIVSGGVPVKNTEVGFTNEETFWQSTVTTNAKGVVDAGMWDGGTFAVLVRRIDRARVVPRESKLVPNHESTIDVPRRAIRGHIADARGTPVSGARVTLHATSQGSRISIHMQTDQEGTFVFDGVEDGAQSVSVAAQGYLNLDSMPVPGDDVRITLSPGSRRELVVVDADGRTAVPFAEVMCVANDVVRSTALTNEEGRAGIAIPVEESSVLWIVPNEGSLAVLRLGAHADGESVGPLEIAVAPAAASLTITALDAAGGPVPDVSFVMRVDDETTPDVVLAELQRRQGIELRTASDGQMRLDHIAARRYQFWPYRTNEQRADILESLGADAPINVVVTAGENRATVRFR